MTWKAKDILEYVKRRPKKMVEETRDAIALEPIPLVYSHWPCWLVVSGGQVGLMSQKEALQSVLISVGGAK
jgi:hypothetical protein